jgi:hypothetical protein
MICGTYTDSLSGSASMSAAYMRFLQHFQDLPEVLSHILGVPAVQVRLGEDMLEIGSGLIYLKHRQVVA